MCERRTWDALHAINFHESASIYKSYCSISFNSAPSMTHYQLAKISISAGPGFECDIQIFLAGRGKICARSLQIVHCQLNYIYYLHNACKCDRWASGIFSSYFLYILWNFQMVPALYQNFVACVTFQQYWALHVVLLPNWMKYYSTREYILQKISFSFFFAWSPFHTVTAFIQSGSWFSWLNSGCSCISFKQLKFVRIPIHRIITQPSKKKKTQETTIHIERRVVCPKFNLSKLWFQLVLLFKQKNA